jgi:hypothetical protein
MQQDNAQERLYQPLSQADPPQWVYDQKSKKIAIQATCKFLEIAAKALSLVEYLHKESLGLCKSVIKEYCDVIYPPVLAMANDNPNDNPNDNLNDNPNDNPHDNPHLILEKWMRSGYVSCKRR